jgi:polyisoprenoid-binding protein YceI
VLTTRARARLTKLLLVTLAILAASEAFAGQNRGIVSFDPDKTTVEFTLGATLHDVHGTFKLKSGVIRFDPATGTASGALIVDATSGTSGNKSRDRKMSREVLESEKYPEIEFFPEKVSGNVPAQGQSEVTVGGRFRIHGSEHPLSLVVRLSVDAGQIRATTQFPVPYQAWGLKNPSTFILRVGDTVRIDIAAYGSLASEQVKLPK